MAGGIAIAKAAQLLATVDAVDEGSFCGSIADAIRPYEATFADLIQALPSRLGEDRETALHAIAWAGSSKPEFSRPIITPFVVPTVLAALWVVLQHQSSWTGAVSEAIHLGGDVDTSARSSVRSRNQIGGLRDPATSHRASWIQTESNSWPAATTSL